MTSLHFPETSASCGPRNSLPAVLRTENQARRAGYQVLAGPYTKPQRYMLCNVLDDLSADPEIAFCLVKKQRGFEIWIRPSPRQLAITRELMPHILHSYIRPLNPEAPHHYTLSA